MSIADTFAALDSLGITRGGGGATCEGPPEAFTVIGLDIEADALAALYPATSGKLASAHDRARAIIRGVRDRTRETTPPPETFVASLEGGVRQRVIVARLGPDKHGKEWAVIVIGRKRTMGLRILNARLPPADRMALPGELQGFANRAGIDAELDALEANAASNVFVAMAPSSMADHAARLRSKQRSPAQIQVRIGAQSTEHVEQLIALSECEEEVQKAADAGKLAPVDWPVYARLEAAEQIRRIKRKLAGNGAEKKNGAAGPRAKTLPAAVLLRIEGEARDRWRAGGKPASTLAALDVFAAGLAAGRGEYGPALAVPALAEVLDAAGYDREAGRMRVGPNARTKGKA